MNDCYNCVCECKRNSVNRLVQTMMSTSHAESCLYCREHTVVTTLHAQCYSACKLRILLNKHLLLNAHTVYGQTRRNNTYSVCSACVLCWTYRSCIAIVPAGISLPHSHIAAKLLVHLMRTDISIHNKNKQPSVQNRLSC